VQAQVLDQLMAGMSLNRVERPPLALRTCLWCALGAILAGLLPLRAGWPRRYTLPTLSLMVAGGLVLATMVAPRLTDWLTAEVLIAVTSLLAAGGVVTLVQYLHLRQLHLTPATIWEVGGSAGSTLMLGTPQNTSDS
jgi:hypothetical protein